MGRERDPFGVGSSRLESPERCAALRVRTVDRGIDIHGTKISTSKSFRCRIDVEIFANSDIDLHWKNFSMGFLPLWSFYSTSPNNSTAVLNEVFCLKSEQEEVEHKKPLLVS